MSDQQAPTGTFTNLCARFAIEYDAPQDYVQLVGGLFTVQATLLRVVPDEEILRHLVQGIHDILETISKKYGVSRTHQMRIYCAFMEEHYAGKASAKVLSSVRDLMLELAAASEAKK